MAKEMEKKNSLYIEPAATTEAAVENGEASKNFDDDGRPKRTGLSLTHNAHSVKYNLLTDVN